MTRSEWATLCDARLKASGITNFSALEICDVGRESQGVSLAPPEIELLDNAIKLIDVLQYVRRAGGVAPVLINSWYRSPDYNQVIGGVPNSMHLTLGAADIVKVNWTPKQVADLLDNSPYKQQLGIGRYRTFTHVDIRGIIGRSSPARWGKNV
jgi:hypothetical protein|tara:strand:+ start:62 stop:520 length:459 start_codon:yes stop_codon:yes gene_type:complete